LSAAGEWLERLRAALGAEAVLTDPERCAPYLTDHRGLCHGRALAVVRPQDTQQVARLLALCHAQRVGVVPQGGNTSYCGGATPDASGTQVVLLLERLARIRAVDAVNNSLTAEAGCTLERVQEAAAQAERFFPLSLGSQGSCQIGGNLATNAGGTNVLRYGMMRDLVLGLEVVLADGRVLDTLSVLRKDNTGYDVKSLFLGAEGTLGIITAASLKLFPAPRRHATALVALADVSCAVALLARLRAASDERLSSFELIPRAGLELAVRHVPGLRDPLGKAYPWYVLCEGAGNEPGDALQESLEQALGAALAAGEVLDAALVRGERERADLWRMREGIPAAQRAAGVGMKHDIALPVSQLGAFVPRAAAWVAEHVPDGELIAYGHVGDGNLHFNIQARPGADPAVFLARTDAVRRAIHDLVHEFGGSFSAEHGIGQLKVTELERYATPVELELMRALKRTLDPHNILNPGKVLRLP